MSSWLEPLCCTRTGAAHTRRGTPCQDACGWLRFQDREGAPVQVMVVADGHGGARYLHSDVGSWLACHVALGTARQLLRAEASGVGVATLRATEERWQRLLAQELPRALHRRWLRAVHQHWQSLEPGEAGDGFSPLLYGTTLGLVVMTPRWWGQTGLGDWDLVRVWADGAQLLSEECDDSASGEATFSLCLPDAAAHFASRSAVETLAPMAAPFTLLLSTDGIRKSCSTDSDFLALGCYLGQAPAPVDADTTIDLAASLDRISSQGSGDDVSVAIALWRPGSPDRPSLESAAAQPAAGTGSQVHPSRPRSLDQRRGSAVAERDIPAGHPEDGAGAEASWAAGDTPRLQDNSAPAQEKKAQSRSLPRHLWLWLAALGIGCIGAVALVVPEPLSQRMRQQVGQLCATPATIRPLLEPKRPTFHGLRLGGIRQGQLLAASDRDPLKALIALSYDPVRGTLSSGPEFQGLQPCPQLQQALRQLWLEAQPPAINPLPKPQPAPGRATKSRG
ncbi:MAG: protein phosphatase 2C domain-containing protein [Cyanobacteria bacterium]|nr:protein phosphatase 2C domain-containing protein [Cyanobacteriota bacterium]